MLGYVATTFGARDRRQCRGRRRALPRVVRRRRDLPRRGRPRRRPAAVLRGAQRAAIGDTFVVLNPGMVPARGYFALADVVVTFEGPFADYARRLALEPGWLRDMPPAKTAHLVYAASRDEASSLFAAPPRAGSLYVTSGSLPNPWGAPPPYLREEHSSKEFRMFRSVMLVASDVGRGTRRGFGAGAARSARAAARQRHRPARRRPAPRPRSSRPAPPRRSRAARPAPACSRTRRSRSTGRGAPSRCRSRARATGR